MYRERGKDKKKDKNRQSISKSNYNDKHRLKSTASLRKQYYHNENTLENMQNIVTQAIYHRVLNGSLRNFCLF